MRKSKWILTILLSVFVMLNMEPMQAQAVSVKNLRAMKAYETLLQKAKYTKGGFFVEDINKDGVKELFVTQELDSTDFTMKYHHYSKVEIYTYTKGKLKKLKKFGKGVYNFKCSKKSRSVVVDLNAVDREVNEVYKIKNGRLIKIGIFDSGWNVQSKFKNCITGETKYFKSYKSYCKKRNKYGTKEIVFLWNTEANRKQKLGL